MKAKPLVFPMSDKNTITAEQSRGARAMLGWSRDGLAEKSGVSPATLADFEAGTRVPNDRTLADVRRALEDAGIQFIPGNGGGPGVRFKKPAASRARPATRDAARKAAKMAAGELEKLAPESQPTAELQQRRRRLIRGPKEFRDIRSDQSKSKRGK
jgi:transcriptional regulator with XRE-family HTH domain